MRPGRPGAIVLCGLGLVLALSVRPASAQFAMPDPKEMSGIPRPVSDLPDRTVSVRLIRGELSNNLTNHPVELLVDGTPRTASTDENGRAEFAGLTPGARLKAVAVVDGERLESQEFPAPTEGGIRLMLVATDKEKEARDAEARNLPAVTGTVVLAGETRLVIEPDEEIARVYYLLDIVNEARAPVTPATPFVFDAPTGAANVTIMEGSSPLATATGTRVRVNGPFPPGTTYVQVAFSMPLSGGALEITQALPADMLSLGLIAKKVGDARLTSPQVTRQQEMPVSGGTYIAAAGGRLAAGQPLVLTLSGMPHHSSAPLGVALGLVAVIVLFGVFAAVRPVPDQARDGRRQLMARREKLLQELVRLEADHRRGRVDQARYTDRREEIVSALERVYGALDFDDTSPEPTGLAA
jgi:hypothetical protein